MNTEQKAKAYDEAIKKMKAMKSSCVTLSYTGKTVFQDLEYIFPELRESEDEKIRKEILEFFQQFENEGLRGINISDWIAWLEKQKSEEINVKALLAADRLAAAEMTGRLKERKDIVENPQKYGIEKQVEQKHAEWSVEDDNHLHSIYHYLRILKDESDNDSVKKNIEEHINWLSKQYQIFLASHFQ